MRKVWIPLLTGLAVVSGCAHSKPAAPAPPAAATSDATAAKPAAAVATTPPPQKQPKQAGAPADQPKSQLIQVTLNARVGQMKIEGQTFNDVIQAIREDSGQNIFVNWRALESARVTKDLPVTTDLSRLTLAEALDQLLAEVGGSQERLAYIIDDDVITVSTRKDIGRRTLTRVYDVRGLLKNPATRDADLAALLRRFKGIDPLSWRDAGGDVGAIRELQGQLIITQTPEVHMRIIQEIEVLLPDQPRPQFPILNTKK